MLVNKRQLSLTIQLLDFLSRLWHCEHRKVSHDWWPNFYSRILTFLLYLKSLVLFPVKYVCKEAHTCLFTIKFVPQAKSFFIFSDFIKNFLVKRVNSFLGERTLRNLGVLKGAPILWWDQIESIFVEPSRLGFNFRHDVLEHVIDLQNFLNEQIVGYTL